MDRALAPDLAATWALVPLRGLADAKTRLGAALDPEERLALVTAMATRTLAATRDAPGLRGTVLVTADPAAAALAARFGARTIVQRLPGLNAALREARAEAVAAGATAVLVLPIDLPAISAATIEALLAEARGGIADRGVAGRGGPAHAADRQPENTSIGDARVRIADRTLAEPHLGDAQTRIGNRTLVVAVPDRHGRGTNALLVSPPGAIDPAFGEDSFEAHAAAANTAGAVFLRHEGPLTLDLDTSDDLLAAGAGGASAEGVAGAGGASARGGRDAA